MKLWRIGLLVGGAAIVVALIIVLDLGGASLPARLPAVEPGPTSISPDATPEASPISRRTTQPTEVVRPIATRTATLRIGDWLDLATGEILRSTAAKQADLFCADITGDGTILECPRGCANAVLPPILVGEPPPAAARFDALRDAPASLTGTWAQLQLTAHEGASGVALAHSHDGQAYKVGLIELHQSQRAFERSVTIRYEPVPAVSGGGRIRLEGQPEAVELSKDALEALRRMRARQAPPEDSFKSFVGSSFDAVVDLPAQFNLPQDANIAVASSLQSEVTILNRGSLYLAKGLGRRGKVTLKSYSGILANGDVDGDIDVQSYAYLHITGSLNGTLTCGSYATVVIDGDVRGVLRVKSYVHLLLCGRFVDPTTGLETRGGGWSTFYFRSFTSRAEIELFPVDSQFSLQVRDSDLPGGRHEHVGRWKEVIVGDPVWRTL